MPSQREVVVTVSIRHVAEDSSQGRMAGRMEPTQEAG